MKKLSIFLMAALSLVWLMPCTAGAAETVSSVSFKNADGIINTLNASDTVTASVNIKNISDGAVLILSLTKDGRIINSDVCFSDAEKKEETLSAGFKLPDDVSGMKLNAMVWRSLEDTAPLISSALLPGSEEGIKYIAVNGELAEDFNADKKAYSMSVSSFDKSAPTVSAPAFDGKTSVDIKTTVRFPGKTKITVSEPEGEVKEYSVSYETDVETLSYDLSSKGGSVLCHSLENGAKPYVDRDGITVENIPECLIGGSYISADSSGNAEGEEKYSFKLGRTARIIFFSENPIEKFENSESGWIKTEGLSVDFADAENGEYVSLANAYALRIVTDEEAEVSVPEPMCDTGEFFVAVAYEYESVPQGVLDEEAFISNLRYTGPSVHTESGDAYFDHPELLNGFDEGSKLYKDNTVLTAAEINSGLKGCDYIITSKVKGSENKVLTDYYGGKDTVEWYSFRLNKSGTVMIFPDSSYGDAMSNVQTDFIKSELSGSSYFSLYNNTWSNIHSERTIMYSKYFEVPEGESVTVFIPNAPGKKSDVWSHIVLVDQGKNELHRAAESAGRVTGLKYAGVLPEGASFGLKFNSVLSEGNPVYANNSDIHFADIHSSVKGKPYIITDNVTNSSYNKEIASRWFGGACDWISFEINKPARIMVITDGDTLKHCSKYGFTKSEESIKYFDAYNTPWNAVLIPYNVMYYKDVDVAEGETETVVIPNAPTWTTQTTSKRAHIVVVDFAD